jgi:tRNA(Arg) A34 adenosine deaminase TadA
MGYLSSIYDNIDGKTASNSHRRYLNTCIRLAKMSSLTHKHGCVIVNTKTDEIVGTGYNKKVTNYSVGNSIHAEVDAIKSVRSKSFHNRGIYVMYIIRLGSPQGYITKYSKPCPVCTNFILKKFHRIRKVYYSTNTL